MNTGEQLMVKVLLCILLMLFTLEAGYADKYDDLVYGGYVNQVRNELDENKFNIVNCGVSGDRVIDLINRLDYIFNKERN